MNAQRARHLSFGGSYALSTWQVSWLTGHFTRRAFPEGKRSFFALAVSRFASACAAYIVYASALQLAFLARTKNSSLS
jgi:hypothetical protein